MNERASRLAIYLALVGLTLGAALSGRFAIALAIAGAKALLVGLEYMELRHAHRAHAVAFVLWALAAVGLVGMIGAGPS